MRDRRSAYLTSRPITWKGRAILSGCLLVVAIILGFAASIALYHVNRDWMRKSDVIGYVLCGEGQHVDDVPGSRRSRRMICRDAAGTEVSARNNLIAVNMAWPFMVLVAVPALWFAWTADIRTRGRG